MGFSNIGAGMNITITLGGPQGAGMPQGGDIPAFQIRFGNAKDRLDRNRGDSDALQDLRNLKKEVDAAVQKEAHKECSGNSGRQDTLEQLLDMIMQLLQMVMGGDEEGEDEEEGKSKEKGPGRNLRITISAQ